MRWRKFCFTAFEKPTMCEEKIRYACWGKEKCPDTDRIHYQGFVQPLVDCFSIKDCQSLIGGQKCHIEKMYGDYEENKTYCLKECLDNEKYEYGEFVGQGQRYDLELLYKNIKEGWNEEQILESVGGPVKLHQYGRTIQKMIDINQKKVFRTHKTECDWYWGPSGCGKSEKLFENYNPDKMYIHNVADKGWWDGYNGHEIVIIDDFRGEIDYSMLLRLTDKYPMSVPRRNRMPAQFIARLILISSPMPPGGYYGSHNDSLDQLLRRIRTHEMKTRVPSIMDYMGIERKINV